MPYRDFPVEYPPLPLGLMLLPRLVADTLPGYRAALAACLGGLFLLACWLGAALARAAGGKPDAETVWRRMGWLGLATGHLLVARFDLLPAVLVAGALLAVLHRRDRLGGVLVGLAFMTKLYPLLLFPPLLALLWGWGERTPRAAHRRFRSGGVAGGGRRRSCWRPRDRSCARCSCTARARSISSRWRDR